MNWTKSHPRELLAGTVAALISLAVYVWTAAPNVTLLDSGEFIVAAQHFGVPHPTGYPLWTLLAWIFQLLPLGNAAWEINVFSGLCGALAVGVTAGILTNLLRWFLEDQLDGRLRTLPPLVGTAFALMLAFSVSMWSQATIAEVYTLHALSVAVYLALLYGWVRHPSHDRLMLAAFFVLALSFSNHHLTLTLAPLPYLLILLLRRRALADWILAGTVTILLGYLAFAILSEDLGVLRTAIRFFYVVAAGCLVFVWHRRLRIRWKLVALLPFAVGAGLLPYAYMPFASSTNPPMNWSYAREARGFYYSVNRSQYDGSLADQSIRVLGKIVGTKPDERRAMAAAQELPGESRSLAAKLWIGFFWQQLLFAFTPFAAIGYFASIFFILRAPLPQRVWIYCLHFAFVLAAFLQPVLDAARIDSSGWWLQMPYHTYTNLIYALLSGLGTGLLIAMLARRRAVYFWLAPALLILPVLTYPGSEPAASQRGRWFGWQYGHDMLKDLPKGSVMIGGTDPGRFVPTYMIFGESPQAPHHKKDPAFDRRDLYIITQNALGEEFYMKYLRDHYGAERPQPKNAFEKWLGRETLYPEKPLVFPTQEQVREIIEQAAKPSEETGRPLEEDPILLSFSSILKWLWEKNRDAHEFFIEESFPLKWTYDYAIPHGLTYRLAKDKVASLSPEVVAEDFAFWADYKTRLLEDPEFKKDLDAQRSFSKLRIAGANIYRHRKMNAEAERAYREALELYPSSVEALVNLCDMLWDKDRHEETIELLEKAYEGDPNSISLIRLAMVAEKRKEMAGEIRDLRKRLDENPTKDDAATLLGIFTSLDQTNKADELVAELLEKKPSDSEILRVLANFTGLSGMSNRNAVASKLLAAAAPKDPSSQLMLARALIREGKTNESFAAAQQAIELGGKKFLEALRSDPEFSAAAALPPFKELFPVRKAPE